MTITNSVQSEFWFHVSDQEDIPLAGEVDRDFDVDRLMSFLKELPGDDQHFDDYLRNRLLHDIELVDVLRQIVGVSDKRMYLELSYLFGRTPRKGDRYLGISGDSVFNLNTHDLRFFKKIPFNHDKEIAKTAIDLFVSYFKKKRLAQSAGALAKLQRAEIVQVIESLILTKEVQQKEAKRRGHGAEFALATVLHQCGAELLPAGRHLNPMGGHDANVDMLSFETAKKERGKTWSTDLIVLDKDGKSRAFVQALIHTSDPGQYGVDKSNQTVFLKASLKKHNEQAKTAKELWGLVDGVGFAENKSDTIDKMLAEFDCFVQLKTLYKAGLRLHQIGLAKVKAILFDSTFYNKDEAAAMYERYCSKDITWLSKAAEAEPSAVAVPAGKATLFI